MGVLHAQGFRHDRLGVHRRGLEELHGERSDGEDYKPRDRELEALQLTFHTRKPRGQAFDRLLGIEGSGMDLELTVSHV
jgi:hypothetical protein